MHKSRGELSREDLQRVILDAWDLSRTFENGTVQAESLEARRAWARDAAAALDVLAEHMALRWPGMTSRAQVDHAAERGAARRRAEAGESFDVRETARYLTFRK